MDNKTIAQKRDELLERTDAANRKYPKANNRSYRKAQKALKKKEEQFFSDEELDMMLPKHLRILQSKNNETLINHRSTGICQRIVCYMCLI